MAEIRCRYVTLPKLARFVDTCYIGPSITECLRCMLEWSSESADKVVTPSSYSGSYWTRKASPFQRHRERSCCQRQYLCRFDSHRNGGAEHVGEGMAPIPKGASASRQSTFSFMHYQSCSVSAQHGRVYRHAPAATARPCRALKYGEHQDRAGLRRPRWAHVPQRAHVHNMKHVSLRIAFDMLQASLHTRTRK